MRTITMEKQDRETVELFLQNYGQTKIRWEDNGRRKATKINGATILYAIHEQRLTFQGATKEKLQTIEEYKILKMSTDCKRRASRKMRSP